MPTKVAAWMHITVGAGLGLIGTYVTDSKAASIAAVLVSVLYVAWTAHRTAGLLLALAVGLMGVLRHGDHGPSAMATAWIWLIAYVLLALVTSVVEEVTRPRER
jgi:hypothetical protein